MEGMVLVPLSDEEDEGLWLGKGYQGSTADSKQGGRGDSRGSREWEAWEGAHREDIAPPPQRQQEGEEEGEGRSKAGHRSGPSSSSCSTLLTASTFQSHSAASIIRAFNRVSPPKPPHHRLSSTEEGFEDYEAPAPPRLSSRRRPRAPPQSLPKTAVPEYEGARGGQGSSGALLELLALHDHTQVISTHTTVSSFDILDTRTLVQLCSIGKTRPLPTFQQLLTCRPIHLGQELSATLPFNPPPPPLVCVCVDSAPWSGLVPICRASP